MFASNEIVETTSEDETRKPCDDEVVPIENAAGGGGGLMDGDGVTADGGRGVMHGELRSPEIAKDTLQFYYFIAGDHRENKGIEDRAGVGAIEDVDKVGIAESGRLRIEDGARSLAANHKEDCKEDYTMKNRFMHAVQR